MKTLHPLCKMLRDLRHASGMSLADLEKHGFNAVVVGSYERGDRNPPLSKLEPILNLYGYTAVARRIDEKATRLPKDLAAELRAIADVLESKNALPELLDAYAPAA